MSCASPAQLAAAATRRAAAGEADELLAHLAACAACRAAFADEQAGHALVASSPVPRLASRHRSALRAELLAASDLAPVPARPRRVLVGAAMLAAAAVIAIVVATSRSPAPAPRGDPPAPRVASIPAPDAAIRDAAPAVAERAEAIVEAHGARLARDGEVIELGAGTLVIDARERRPVQVVAGEARVVVDAGRASITAVRGQLVQIQVFAGSVELSTAGGTRVVSFGEIWTAPSPVKTTTSRAAPVSAWSAFAGPPAEPPPALAAFRTGWEALRAGRNAEAIAAFDRATDPAVAEDAMYWAAIAAARSGDRDGARERLRAFLAAYPASPHGDTARAELAR